MASLVWGSVLYAQVTGQLNLSSPEGVEEATASPAVAASDAPEEARTPSKRRKRRRRPAADGAQGPSTDHNAITSVGDTLGGTVQTVHAGEAGGQSQLRPGEIEAGFDDALPQITRCLILAASDVPLTGKLVFGLRIAGSGEVAKVNLRGPRRIVRGEAGDCLRQLAHGLQFRSFDGPAMTVHYPITLE